MNTLHVTDELKHKLLSQHLLKGDNKDVQLFVLSSQ